MISLVDELIASVMENVEWTPDCQGKWDFDFTVTRVSSRYYPSGYMRNTKCSAHSSFYTGEKLHEYQEFEADTEAEVRTLVKSWVRSTLNKLLTKAFTQDRPKENSMQIFSIQHAAKAIGVDVDEVLHTAIVPSQAATFFVVKAKGRGVLLLSYKDGQMFNSSLEALDNHLESMTHERAELEFVRDMLKPKTEKKESQSEQAKSEPENPAA